MLYYGFAVVFENHWKLMNCAVELMRLQHGEVRLHQGCLPNGFVSTNCVWGIDLKVSEPIGEPIKVSVYTDAIERCQKSLEMFELPSLLIPYLMDTNQKVPEFYFMVGSDN